MASIIYQKQKSGIIYAYSSESYWDKDLKKVRTKKEYLGRYDPETKQIIPKKDKTAKPAAPASTSPEELAKLIEEKDRQIAEKDQEIARLQAELDQLQEKVQAQESILDELAKLLSTRPK